MIAVKISADLEKKIRAGAADNETLASLVKVIENSRTAKELLRGKLSGVPFSTIVSQFRAYLGRSLAIPYSCGQEYKARVVKRYAYLNLDNAQVEHLCSLVTQYHKAPYALDWLLFNAERIMARPEMDAERPEETTVITGRIDD